MIPDDRSKISYLARVVSPGHRSANLAMNVSLFDQVRQLSVEEQIELVEALWDNIVERNAVPCPTEAQKAELDRRLSEHAAHPDDVVPWSEVKDSALTRIRR